MKKYYFHNGVQQQGPFDLDDLKTKGINEKVPIWYNGLPKWTKAGKLDELQELFREPTAPPPAFAGNPVPAYSQPVPPAPPRARKKNSPWPMIFFVLVFLAIVWAIVALAI